MEIPVIRVRVCLVKTTEKWDEIQGKLYLVPVNGVFELLDSTVFKKMLTGSIPCIRKTGKPLMYL